MLLLGLLWFYCKRSRPVHKVQIVPFPDDASFESPVDRKIAPFTSWNISLPRLDHSIAHDEISDSLMAEIFPLPSEVEDANQRLQRLSAAAASLNARARSGLFPAIRTEDVQAGISVLRADVNRLRRYSMRSERRSSKRFSAMSQSIQPPEMLRELALLRSEIDELLAEMQSGKTRPDSLPRYSSQFTSTGSIFYETPLLPPKAHFSTTG